MSEKEKILQMIAEGKISVEDGERLLKAIHQNVSTADLKTSALMNQPQQDRKKKSRQRKIIVDIRSAKGENIKVNLPLKLANWASRMIPKEKLAEVEMEGFNISEILSNLSDMIDEVDEDIVNITSANGDRIRVYLEKND